MGQGAADCKGRKCKGEERSSAVVSGQASGVRGHTGGSRWVRLRQVAIHSAAEGLCGVIKLRTRGIMNVY